MLASSCDEDIYKNGKVVAMLSGEARAIESLVAEANRVTEHKMDWHYFGGRAIVKTLGDVVEADKALRGAYPEWL